MGHSFHQRVTAIGALALIWLAMLLLGTGGLDRHLLLLLYAGGHPTLIAGARFITFLGQPPVLLTFGFAAAGWLWWRHWPGYAVAVLVVTLAGRGLAEVQKFTVERSRPMIVPHLVSEYTPSFPSGHATSSMIVYLTLALVLTEGSRWSRAAVPAAVGLSLLIGLSRPMLGVHWPSDVVAGWSFGALWVIATVPLAERVASRYRPRPLP
ncbi:MAG TPA: phosphatase PAP2 family protein [Sphingomicrobium sp.]|nr:phosphatase PAP2 family protein [Sphingomicrobium sp.]